MTRQRGRRSVLITVVAICSLVVPMVALAGPIGTASGFEDDDANLIVNTTGNVDWNAFAGAGTLSGTAPFRDYAGTSASGWRFLVMEDARAVTSDTGFAGGTKQDENCPDVISAKAPNKDDLRSAAVASKTLANGHFILNLAWLRIPQNTTSASAHIAYEFNRGEVSCGEAGDLISRTAGDILVVYDFEGGDAIPIINLSRWVTTGACEVNSHNAPCWSPQINLTAAGFAEANVNDLNTVQSDLEFGATALGTATLGDAEFGEAGIDLTAAGVFPVGTCANLGSVFAASRTSGSSSTAQMKDLVGPGDFNVSNCGTVTIIKHTVPADLDQDFGFTSTLAGAQIDCDEDATPASFILNDVGAGNDESNTETCVNVPAGDYTVTEGDDPVGFTFDDVTCTASTGSSGTQDATVEKEVDIHLIAGGSVTCTYVNNQNLGAIKITKTSSKTGNALDGAQFSITKGGTAIAGSPFTTDANGEICVDGLVFGDYVVTETVAPTGFEIDDPAGRTVTVDTNTDCEADPYIGEEESFTDTPTAKIQVRWADEGSGETDLVTDLSCTNTSTGVVSTEGTTGWNDTLTVTGLDAPVTLVCTIDIDP